MSNVTIDITIRSQGATSGAQKTKQALKQVENSAQKTAEAVERSNKALNDTKTVNTAHSAMGRLSTRLQRLGRNFKSSTKSTQVLGKSFDDLSRTVRLVDGPLGGVAARMQTIGGILKFVNPGMVAFTLGLAAVAGGAKVLSGIAQELEKAMFKVDAIIAVTGRSSEITAKQIDEVAINFGRLTLSSREAGLSASAAALTFRKAFGKDLAGELQFTLEAAQGISATFGGDLVGNTRLVARALENPAKAAEILRRQIGELDDETKDQLVTLQRTGRLEEAQALVRQKLTKFTVLAAAEAKGYAGSLDTLGENLRRAAGKANQFLGVTTLLNTAVLALSGTLDDLLEPKDVKSSLIGAFAAEFGELFALVKSLDVAITSFSARAKAVSRERAKIAEEKGLSRFSTTFGFGFSDADDARISDAGERAAIAAEDKATQRLRDAINERQDARRETRELLEEIGKESSQGDTGVSKTIENLQKEVAQREQLSSVLQGNLQNYEKLQLQQRIDDRVSRELERLPDASSPEAYKKSVAQIKALVTQSETLAFNEQKRLSVLKEQENVAERQARRLERQTSEVDLLLSEEEDLLRAARLGTEAYEQRVLTRRQNEEILRRTTGLEEKQVAILQKKIEKAFEFRRERERELDIQREAEKAYRDIEQDLTDTVEQGLRGGAKGGFDAILDYAENIFYRDLAAIFAKSVLDGLVVPAAQGLGGILGAGQPRTPTSGAAGALDTVGSLSNLSSLTNLTSIGKSLSGTFLPSGIASSVDSIGQSVFGIGQKVAGPFTGAGGPFTEGVSGGLSSSFNLANIGAGIAGSFAASALFGDGIGTSVGSSLGGIGAGLGTAALGLGPLGAAAAVFGGSLLGGGLGSLFGNSEPSSRLQSGFIDLSTGQLTGRGGLRGEKFSQENQALVDSLSQVSATLARTFGITNQQIAVAASDRYGLEFAFSDDPRVFDFDSEARQQFDTANQFFEALTSAFAEQASEDISEKTQNALKRLDFGEGEEALQTALSDVVFAVNFEKIFEEPVNESLSQVEQQVKTLNETFDRYTVAAKRLGFAQEDINRLEGRRVELAEEYIDSFIKQRQSTTQAEQAIEQINEAFDALTAATEESRLGVDKLAEVERARAKGLQDLTRGFESGVGASILEIISPRTNALVTEGQRYRAQIREAEALGADLRQVELLHKLNLLEIEREYGTELDVNGEKAVRNAREVESLINGYERLVESLDDALFDLRIGQNSTLSPSQKLAQAESRFLSLRDAALGGDLDAAGQLASVGNEFLTLSRQYSAITEEFVADFQLVERTLEETKSFAITELDVQRGILATLETGFADMLNALGGVSGILGINENVDVFTQANSNAAGRSLQETAAYGLSVGQIEAVGRDLLGGYTGATGSGELSRMLAERGLAQTFDESLRNLAGFADGGITPANQPFIVGERGPEIMSFNTSARVTPIDADASRQIAEGNRLASQQVETLQRGFAVLADQMEAMIAAQQMANANAQVSRIRKAPK